MSQLERSRLAALLCVVSESWPGQCVGPTTITMKCLNGVVSCWGRTPMHIRELGCVLCVLSLACSSPKPGPASQGRSAERGAQAPEHLAGKNVGRYPVDTAFVERTRYVLQGERVGKNCRYRSKGALREGEIETVLEEDYENCIALRRSQSIERSCRIV